ncbi:MAG: hypothetical protein F9K40_01795 [Kofleriaceae bacterium]|nr:MAG: hypothetical protein F9K40_01795 [Kofleriaceae bacterium]MBZ0235797.1 hypothetical protein [Kofleriaceae bacterium]
MKRFISTLFGLAVLCVFAQAQAVPATVSFTGRLTTSTGPVSGAVTVTFKLFDQSTNGTEQWSEQRSLTATNGLVYADLGAMTTLDTTVLDNSSLYLEIQVGAEILTPRLPLQSVPYAIRSEVANTAETLGTIAPGDVVTTVNASGGISAARSGNTVTLTGTGVSGTAPIAVAGGAVSLTTCAANQVYKMTGGTWQCAADANTTYTAVANGGVTVGPSTIGLTTCAVGQVLKSTGSGTYGCAADNDAGGDITGVTAGTGLSGGGTTGALTLSVNTSVIQQRVTGTCAVGSAIRAIDAAGAVTCDSGGSATGTLLRTSSLTNSCAGNVTFSTTLVKVADIGTFTKNSGTSRLEVTHHGRLAVTGTMTANGARFELRVNDVAASSGLARAIVKSAEVGSAGVHASMTGIWTGLAAGTYTVSLWVQGTGGTGGGTGAYVDPGCWASSHTVVKEFAL